MDSNQYIFRSLNNLSDLTLMAQDGEIGQSSDYYFSDEDWRVHYLVADIGSWLADRRVLLSPMAVQSSDDNQLNVNLTRSYIENSPEIDWAKPISRQYEAELFDYYRWQPYWYSGLYPGDMGGMVVVPPLSRDAMVAKHDAKEDSAENQSDPHLRSVQEVTGYSIETLDGSIGHLEDFVVNLNNWTMRFFVVDTRNWLPGKKVVLPLTWIDGIDWAALTVSVDLSQESIRNAPELDIDQLNQDMVAGLYSHYGRQTEWDLLA